MKYVLIVIGIFFSFVLGYLLEPQLRDALLGVEKIAEREAPAAEKIVEPEPKPIPEPEPEPEPTDEGEPLPAAPTDNEIQKIMYESIQQAEIHHFTILQVTEWKSFGEEVIDGQTYQYGLIDYVEDTIFGERTFEAKALIRDGKVEKWIWTANNMPIN